jgi:hypothetical protein
MHNCKTLPFTKALALVSHLVDFCLRENLFTAQTPTKWLDASHSTVPGVFKACLRLQLPPYTRRPPLVGCKSPPALCRSVQADGKTSPGGYGVLGWHRCC